MSKSGTILCEFCNKKLRGNDPEENEKLLRTLGEPAVIKPARGRKYYLCQSCVKKAMKGK